jgi:hypothetical protein
MRVSTRLLSLFGIHFSFPFLIASRFLALMDRRIEPLFVGGEVRSDGSAGTDHA